MAEALKLPLEARTDLVSQPLVSLEDPSEDIATAARQIDEGQGVSNQQAKKKLRGRFKT